MFPHGVESDSISFIKDAQLKFYSRRSASFTAAELLKHSQSYRHFRVHFIIWCHKSSFICCM